MPSAGTPITIHPVTGVHAVFQVIAALWVSGGRSGAERWDVPVRLRLDPRSIPPPQNPGGMSGVPDASGGGEPSGGCDGVRRPHRPGADIHAIARINGRTATRAANARREVARINGGRAHGGE